MQDSGCKQDKETKIRISGIVTHGQKLGRKIGFPTANIPLGHADDIENGVYAATVTLESGENYRAMAYIGVRPSVNGIERRAEVSLFDFDGDLYGTLLRIDLLHRIRGEKRFGSVEDLRKAIEADRDVILGYFGSL